MYANIIVDISHEQLDKTFQYHVPDALLSQIDTGVMVNIPFGRGNRIITGYVIELTSKAEFDEEKIKRVVANIVGNAVKYIQREQGMILVNVEDQGSFIQVMIRDNGKGIGKEELPFIFERFYRTDSSRNSRTGGSGLGLAIAKKIMDEHGGRIWAESELGKGTEVYFTLKKETEQKEEHDE